MDDPKEDLKPMNLDQLYFAFGLLAIGIIFAYIAFMIEITAGWISNKMLEIIGNRKHAVFAVTFERNFAGMAVGHASHRGHFGSRRLASAFKQGFVV